MRQLYLGLDPSRLFPKAFHYPLLKVIPLPFEELEWLIPCWKNWQTALLTSRTTVFLLADFIHLHSLSFTNKSAWVVGKATAAACENAKIPVEKIAQEESQEGLLSLLTPSTFFYPHSKKARPLLAQTIKEKNWPLLEAVLYDVQDNLLLPPIDLKDFEEIIFTSPSTVDAFFRRFGSLPPHCAVHAIGPITAQALRKKSVAI